MTKLFSRELNYFHYIAIFTGSFLGLLMLAPFFLSLGMIGLKLIREFSFPLFFGSSFFLFLLFLFLQVCKANWVLRTKYFLLWVCLFSFVCKLLVVLLFSSHFSLTQDYALMHKFVGLFVSEGIDSVNLHSFYDWRAFANRSFPFFWPMRFLFGDHDLLAVQIANSLLETGSLLLVYVILGGIVDEYPRRITVCLLALFPLHTWEVLNYTHDIPGTFLFLSCLLIIKTIWLSSFGKKIFVYGLLLGALLFALKLQRGLHQFVLINLFALFCLQLIKNPSAWDSKRYFIICICVVVLPMLVYLPSAKLFDKFKDTHQVVQLKGGKASFMARGWNMESLGEYNWLYEGIDIATPKAEKAQVQKSIIASQVKYNPLKILGLLPIIKSSKFFMIGYASCVGDNLRAGNQQVAADIVKATRIIFTPFLLCFVLVGLFNYIRRKETEVLLVWLGTMPLVACLILVMLGEVSPRYSYFFHFILCVFAAEGINVFSAKQAEVCSVSITAGLKKVCISGVIILFCYSILAGTVYGTITSWGKNYLFQDMRNAGMQSNISTIVKEIELLPGDTLEPFEQWLVLPQGMLRTGEGLTGEVVIPSSGDSGYSLALYLYSPVQKVLQNEQFVCTVSINDSVLASYSLEELSHKKRITRFSTVGKNSATVPVKVGVTITHMGEKSFILDEDVLVLRWGYLALRPLAASTGDG